MLFTKVSIHTVAHLEAPCTVSSSEIASRLANTLKRVHLPLNVLERMTGIKERRFWSGDTQPSDVATEVAEKVIQNQVYRKVILVPLSARPSPRILLNPPSPALFMVI